MPHILVADGTPGLWQAARADFGIPSNPALFAAALRVHQPDIRCSSINIADGESLPPGMGLYDLDGVMFTGSPLHIYDPTPEVTRQVDFARAAFAAGVPVWGSCWGLQLATVALGGSVRRNPRGREIGIARAITVNDAGRAHFLLASRPAVFDSLCSHLDEVETLPPDAQVLAGNTVSAIQAMAVRTPQGGSFFGTQYHPEHTLAVSAALIDMRADALVEEGLCGDRAEATAVADDYRALHADPSRRDLRWRYGIGNEILDPGRRSTEIGNWLRAITQRQQLVA